MSSSNEVETSSVHLFSKGQRTDRGESLQRTFLQAATYAVVLIFALILGRILILGLPVILQSSFPFVNTQFFTERPQILVEYTDENLEEVRMTKTEFRAFQAENPDAVILSKHEHNYSGGGIFSPLVGTVFIVGICIVLAMIVGISAAVYLSEYAKGGRFISAVRLAILNLAGVPSIVFGLFGVAFFCFSFPVISGDLPLERSVFSFQIPLTDLYFSLQGWGQCMLAAGCTLACMILPVIITACEESLKAVPTGFRMASLALGASQWTTIRKSVLPYALPGMLTASVLGMTRVAGETAPIMYTGALASADLPWEDLGGDDETAGVLSKLGEFFLSGVEAMPYHIYTVSAKIPQEPGVKPMQYGSVFVFMMIVMLFAAVSVYLRMRIRRNIKW